MKQFFALNSVILLGALNLAAQQYTISTIVGGVPPPTGSGIYAGNSPVGTPGAVATDSLGNVYFVSYNSVFKVDTLNALYLVAGNSRQGFAGDGSSALVAQFNTPGGIAVDNQGRVYISDTNNNRIRRIETNGTIITFAGTGVAGFSPDGTPAGSAQLNSPQGLAFDASQNLYVADSQNNIVRVITNSDGHIHTVAGTGAKGFGADGGSPTLSSLNAPNSVAVDNAGNLFIADTGNNRVREVIASNNIIATIAGATGIAGFSGDGNPGGANAAQLNNPTFVAVDNAGSVYISDTGNLRVRKVVLNSQLILTYAGAGIGGVPPLGSPRGIALDPGGNLYLADYNNSQIYKIVAGGASATFFAGNSGTRYYLGENVTATSSQLAQPEGIALDPTTANVLYIADPLLGRLRKVVAGVISTAYQPPAPAGVAVDNTGAVYIADTSASTVIKLFNGTITTIAGTGVPGYTGDGTANSVPLNRPNGLAIDSLGNVYIADTGNNRVVKIAGGILTTIAGTSAAGYSGEGVANRSQLNQPYGVAVDKNFNVYIADTANNRIRMVTLGGLISTYAGNGAATLSGDSAIATNAAVEAPHGVALDTLGNLYIAEGGNTPAIRKVATNQIITTIAGTGVRGYSGDGGSASAAQFSLPWGIAVDSGGNVFVSDASAQAVRLMSPTAAPVLSILTSAQLPNGTVGTPYSQALSASGGTPPYSWSLSIGALPAGLTLLPSGSIVGTPTVAGSAQFTLQVTDSASVIATKTVQVTISALNQSGLNITTNPTLAAAATGISYSQLLSATGGTPPYNWAVVAGTLPAGLTLQTNGILSGFPSTPGAYSFTVRVLDLNQSTAIQTFNLSVVSPGTLSRVGVFGHFAAGGPWTTRVYLQNVTTNTTAVTLHLYADDGTGLAIPLTVTQQGTAQVMSGPSITAVLNPNTTLTVDVGTGLANTVTGWMDVMGSGPLTGFSIFHTTSNGVSSEGTAPLQTFLESKLDVPYDNTSGYLTGVAVANLTAAPTTVTATIVDPNGNTLGTASLSLPSNGHTSFLFPTQFAVSTGQQGIVLFQSSAGNIAGVGLRAATASGTFTSIPIILP